MAAFPGREPFYVASGPVSSNEVEARDVPIDPIPNLAADNVQHALEELEARAPIAASDVSTEEVIPGVPGSNVQQSLEEIYAEISASGPASPTTIGGVYGLITLVTGLFALGYNVATTATNSINIYARLSGAVQTFTQAARSILISNESSTHDSIVDDSVVLLSNSDLNGNNAVSSIIISPGGVSSQADGTMEDSIYVGRLDAVERNVADSSQSIVLKPRKRAGETITIGVGSTLIGSGGPPAYPLTNRVLANYDLYFDGYARMFMRILRGTNTTTTDYANKRTIVYNPSTFEITASAASRIPITFTGTTDINGLLTVVIPSNAVLPVVTAHVVTPTTPISGDAYSVSISAITTTSFVVRATLIYFNPASGTPNNAPLAFSPIEGVYHR